MSSRLWHRLSSRATWSFSTTSPPTRSKGSARPSPRPAHRSSDPGLGPAKPDPGLPPYSPDLNPIEQLFAKLKALLRKAAARTIDALWATIGQLLDRFPPHECARYLAHCGYGST